MKPARFHSEADAELRSALEWYNDQRAGLGGELLSEVLADVKRACERPHSYAAIDRRKTRACLVHRFPYTVFFVELEHEIWIVAIAHHRRRPRFWAKRRPE